MNQADDAVVIGLNNKFVHSLPAHIALRLEEEVDREFMAHLYVSTRTEELAPVPWPEEAKQAFLQAQFELQRDHYRKHCDSIAASVSGCWKTAASITFSNGDRIS
jgi:hypothetical protein